MVKYEEWEGTVSETIRIDHRLQLLTETIRLLLTMVAQQRGRPLREAGTPYSASPDDAQPDASHEQQLNHLLHHIPLPDP